MVVYMVLSDLQAGCTAVMYMEVLNWQARVSCTCANRLVVPQAGCTVLVYVVLSDWQAAVCYSCVYVVFRLAGWVYCNCFHLRIGLGTGLGTIGLSGWGVL